METVAAGNSGSAEVVGMEVVLWWLGISTETSGKSVKLGHWHGIYRADLYVQLPRLSAAKPVCHFSFCR